MQISLIKGDTVYRKEHPGMSPRVSPQPAFRAQGLEVVEWKLQLCHSAVSSQGQLSERKESLVLQSVVGLLRQDGDQGR